MFPENWIAVQAFLACQTQWNVGGMDGTLLGLNYSSVEVMLKLHKANKLENFDKIRVMESEMLSIVRKRRK